MPQPYAAFVFLACLALVGAVEIQRLHQHAAASVASHATALARALKSKRARMGTDEGMVVHKLRGVAVDVGKDDDSDDDEDDDDDDDDGVGSGLADALDKNVSDKTLAASTALLKGVQDANEADKKKKEKKGEDKETADEAGSGKTAEEDKTAEKDKRQKEEKKAAAEKKEKDAKEKKKVEAAAAKERREAEDALKAARKKQETIDREFRFFKDDEAFDAKIAEETKLMTNETQSPALASFLGSFRTEMRKYAMPAYPAYLQSKLDAANSKVEALEAEKERAEKLSKILPMPKKKAEKETKDAAAISAKAAGKDEKVTTEARNKVEIVPSDTAKEVAQKAGETWAVSFFANVAMLAVVFAMASAENKTVKNYTWFLIDQVVAIFLAVMYFNAFDSLLDFHEMGVGNTVVASAIHAIVMFAVVICAAAALKAHKIGLAILCGAGAHVVSFSSIHAAASAQGMWVGMSYTYSMCIFGICTVAIGLGIIGYLTYTVKERAGLHKEDDFMDKTTDLENDFGAMAFSVIFTMLMRFILTGHHPVDDDTDFDHTRAQRTAMFFYAIACLIIAGFVVSFCSKKAADAQSSMATRRVMNFCSTVVTMNVAWAWLYWGEWEFFEALYPGEAVKGRVMFAITMTMLGGCGLIGLSKIKIGAKGPEVKTEKKVALTALSLVIAWSWELCFDAAVEDMCEGVAHPVGWKVLTTLSLASIVVPVYAYYMKPISMKAYEEIGA